MKICPHCSQEIPGKETKCPWCGKEYWLPGKTEEKNSEEKETEEFQELGCLQIFLMPLFVAFISFLFLIASGVIIHLLVNFENNQIKIVWLIFSFLAGLAIYLLLSILRKPKGKNSLKEEKDEKNPGKG